MAPRVACILGWPAAKSLSPAIHNAAFAACGLDWTYVAFDVPPERLRAAVEGLRALGIAGANVTMPHKRAVIAFLDEVSGEAERCGAVNTIVRRGDRLHGMNTDGEGFVRFLEREAGVDPKGTRVLILGAGGAARALAVALSDAGAELTIAARRSEAAEELAALARGKALAFADAAAAAFDVSVIVNATPLGMDGSSFPIDPSSIGAKHVVVDLVYSPPSTPLLEAARARGATSYNGIGLLVHQAALAFEAWTGVPAPVETMSRIAHASL